MKTTENNKLIAEFMGQGAQLHLVEHPSTGEYVDAEYHTSWDWLMPVVEKCLCSTEDDSGDFDKHYDAIHDALWSINIESTYKAVVEFIEWYNENK